MTALEPPPPADRELLARVEARQVRCPRCGRQPGEDCDMTMPGKNGTYHHVRADRARQGW